MRNIEIIKIHCLSIYGKDLVSQWEKKNLEMPLHTAKGWEQRGYKVKQGEKAEVETKLWQKKGEKIFLAKCFLFTLYQVEPM